MNRFISNPLAGYLLLAALGIVLFWANPLTAIATNYNRDIAIAGTSIYASLRSITSVMSLVKDTDVQASIPLLSVATSPGQMLQPVISTIDRMSNLLFALVVSSGVLAFTLPIVSTLGSAVIIAGAGTSALARMTKSRLPVVIERAVRGCISLGIFAAVGIPLAYSIAFVIGDRITAQAWEEASAVFEGQAEVMATANVAGVDISTATIPADLPSAQQPQEQEGNVLDWARSTVGGAVQGSTEAIQGALAATTGFATALKDQLAAGTNVITDGVAAASALFEASVKIGVAYLVKLIVLPVLVLLGFLWVMRSVSRPTVTMAGETVLSSVRYVDSDTTADNA